jgi:hypothetical protein
MRRHLATASSPSIFAVIMRKQILLWLLSAFALLVAAGGLSTFFERKNPHFKSHNKILTQWFGSDYQ